MPSISEGAETHYSHAGGTHDLPPHRAAIPVAPAFLHAHATHRRHALIGLAIVFSLAAHAGFFWAASLWGQGTPLLDADAITAVIRVEVAQIRLSETIVAKSPPTAEAAQPRAEGGNALTEAAQTLAEGGNAVPEAAQTRAEVGNALPEAAHPRAEDGNAVPETAQARAEGGNALAQPAQSRAEGMADGPPSLTAASEQPSPAALQAEIEAVSTTTGAAQAEDAGNLAMLTAIMDENDGKPAPAREEQPTPAAPAPAEIVIASAGELAFDAANASANGYKPPNRIGNDAQSDAAAPRFPADRARRLRTRSASNRGAMFNYKRRVRAQVIRNLPEGRWGPGRVVIAFRLSRSGELLAASVRRSSGNFAIDQAALACVHIAGPYPYPPPRVTSEQLAISIVFRFE